MAQIKVLDLDNACSLSELNREDMNIVKGGGKRWIRYPGKGYDYPVDNPLAARANAGGKLWVRGWPKAASLSTPA